MSIRYLKKILVVCVLLFTFQIECALAVSNQVIDEIGVLSQRTIQNIQQLNLDPSVSVIIPRSLRGKTIDQYGISLAENVYTDKNILVIISPQLDQSRLIMDDQARRIITPQEAHYINHQIILAGIRNGNIDDAVYQAAAKIQSLISQSGALKPRQSVPVYKKSQTAHNQTDISNMKEFFIILGVVISNLVLYFWLFYFARKHFKQKTKDITDFKQEMKDIIATSYVTPQTFAVKKSYLPSINKMIRGAQSMISSKQDPKLQPHIHTDARRYQKVVSPNRPDTEYNDRYNTRDLYDMDDLF